MIDQNFEQIFSHAYLKICLGCGSETFISYVFTYESGPFLIFNELE